MTIKEASKICGISPDTLRYYEKMKVIPAVERSKSGIRNYKEEDLGWIKNAKCMRKAGFSIEAIAKYVELFMEGDETISDRLELLKEQREILYRKREEIEETLVLLGHKINIYENAAKTGMLDFTGKDE
ncbi:MAG: MerR family transcriptional regulator [Clostridiales bacterium]|nr:MerR family transcriptional regulator [Clostridiales bacterium]